MKNLINSDNMDEENLGDSLIRVSGMYKDWFLDYASYVILELLFRLLKMGLSQFKEGFFIQ